MIKDEVIAKRYADAFLAYAKETIGSENGLGELQEAKRIIRDNADLAGFLGGPEFTNTEKFGAVDGIFKDLFSPEVLHLIKLLIEKKRIALFADIAEYARIHYAHGVEIDAVLETSYPVETRTIQKIKDALRAGMKKPLHLYVRLDPDLLGGARARIGNIIIDGSVRKRLEDMKDKLHALRVDRNDAQAG